MMITATGCGLIDCAGVEGVEDWQSFVPARQSDGAVGYDIRACQYLDPMTREVIGDFPVTIKPRGFALFGIGVVMAVPPGVDSQVRPRSGLATKHHVVLANGPGTVDPDYRGQVACSMANLGNEPYTINRGDRIAQLVFTPILLPQFHLVDSQERLPKTTRADGGFGSSGVGGSGYGTAGHDSIIRELDVYLMEIVLATARRSNCARGCERDAEGKALRDDRGRLVGQRRRIGCVIARGDKWAGTL
jgi:dUTP pyrophosphatase